MTRRNKTPLSDRVASAAEQALAEQQFVAPLDVLTGLGWLDGNTAKRWRQGQIDTLEHVMQSSPPRIAEAMQLFCAWASAKGLLESETAYVGRDRQPLRFSASGDPEIERLYRTHRVSPEVSERKRERLAEKASKTPDLVVIQPLARDWTCHRCGGGGGWLVMETPGPACLACVGLGDLEFLPAGDATLTRRAKKVSARHAVVVKFSRARKRYERQGLLLEPQAIEAAESPKSSPSRS